MYARLRFFTLACLAALTLMALPRAAAAQDIVDVATAQPELSIFFQAVDAAGLRAAMKEKGPFTLFAPTNAAFEALPPGALDKLMLPGSKEDLAKLIKNHVVPGTYTQERFLNAPRRSYRLRTGSGNALNFNNESGAVLVKGDAGIIRADIRGSNGIVHIIDKVLLIDR